MNVTEFIFLSAMFFFVGMLLGKCFKRLNPFFILFGLIVFAPVIQLLAGNDQWLYSVAFVLGFAFNFGNPFAWISGVLLELTTSFQLFKAKRNHTSDFEHANKQNKAKGKDYQHQQSEAEEQMRRAADDLRQREEAFKRKQEQFYKEQATKKSSSSQEQSKATRALDPRRFDDACEILGGNPDKPFDEFKKAYRRLMSMYHPDKINQLGAARRSQAEEEAKQINAAWDTVKKKLK